MTLTEPTTTFTQAAHDILSGKPYATIPLARGSTERMKFVMNGLFDFDRTVPLEEQKRWQLHVPRNPAKDEPDDGIIRRNDPEKISDHKLMLHARADLVELLKGNGVALDEPWLTWVSVAVTLRNAMHATFAKFAQAVDRECPDYRLVERLHAAEASTLNGVLRALMYPSNGRGYARSHTDRNGASIHINETMPGLYFVGAPELPPLAEDTGIIFPSDMLEEISGGAIKASKHGARSGATCCPRSSGVYFDYFAL